jgi:ribonuclease HI
MWTIFYDGSWGPFGARVATIIISLSKMKISDSAKLEFQCTNNIAEYEAILLGLWKLKAMGVKRTVLKSDSQVITCHVDKISKARSPTLEKYLDTVQRMEGSFEGFLWKYSKRR